MGKAKTPSFCAYCGSPVKRGHIYCAACSTERRRLAALHFGATPITDDERQGKYIIRSNHTEGSK